MGTNTGGRYPKFKHDKITEQERAMWFPCGEGTDAWDLDSGNPATVAQLGTAARSQVSVLEFDAFDSDSDDVVFLHFVVPTDYKTDSMRIDLIWTHSDGDNSTEIVTWIATANSVAPSAESLEAFDAAGSTITATLTKTLTASSAGKLYKNTLNPEVEEIVAGDLLTIKLILDASATNIDTGEVVQLIGALVRWNSKES